MLTTIVKQRMFLYLLVTGFILAGPQGYCDNKANPKKAGTGYPSKFLTGLVIDGNPADWPSGNFYNDNDAKVLYAAANDSTHLYICLQVLDPAEQAVIIHEGVILWLDPRGKKGKDCSVRFTCGPMLHDETTEAVHNSGHPGGVPPQGSSPQGAPVQGAHPHGQHKMAVKPAVQRFPVAMQITGFRAEFNGNKPYGETGGDFRAAVAYDSTDVLNLEVMIPLSAFQSDPYKGKCLAIGFEIKNPGGHSGLGGTHGGSQPGHQQGGGGGMGGMHGGGGGMGGMHEGGGGMHGGGMHNGGGPGQHGGNDSQNEAKTYKIWHKISLALMPGA